MPWGTFERDDAVHVIPVDKNGCLIDHVVDCFCKCHPEVLEIVGDGKMLIVHNQVH